MTKHLPPSKYNRTTNGGRHLQSFNEIEFKRQPSIWMDHHIARAHQFHIHVCVCVCCFLPSVCLFSLSPRWKRTKQKKKTETCKHEITLECHIASKGDLNSFSFSVLVTVAAEFDTLSAFQLKQSRHI